MRRSVGWGRRSVGLGSAALLLSMTIVGCSRSELEFAPVSGRVTLDGAPLEGATVEFQPIASADSVGSPSSGVTNAKGNYELKFTFSQDGAMLGDHIVRIRKPERVKKGDKEVTQESLPAKYNIRSDIKRPVKDEKNRFDFELESEQVAEKEKP